MEKVTLECVDTYFDILFASMPLLPGPAPARTLFRQSWKRVAPAYVANADVHAFSQDEGGNIFMLWGYAWRHFARGRENQLCSGSADMQQRFRCSRSAKMTRLRGAIEDALNEHHVGTLVAESGSRVPCGSECNVVQLADMNIPTYPDGADLDANHLPGQVCKQTPTLQLCCCSVAVLFCFL